jgi:hypothetical protein
LPSLFVLESGILSPPALAEWVKPIRFGLARDVGGMAPFGLLTVVLIGRIKPAGRTSTHFHCVHLRARLEHPSMPALTSQDRWAYILPLTV